MLVGGRAGECFERGEAIGACSGAIGEFSQTRIGGRAAEHASD